MMLHCFVPCTMLKGEIRPVFKAGKTSKTDSENYRPVMNSSVFLKLLEYLILPVLKSNLNLSSRQFGFRPGTNCQSAVLMLQEVVKSYTELNSNVHCAMLDLTKAFDRMNFNILIAKLKKTHLPMQLVNLLDFMLRNSFASLSYNGFKG